MKIYYKKYDLKEYLGEEIFIETLIVARLKWHDSRSILEDRSVIVVPVRYYDNSIDRLDLANIFLNPIPLIPALSFEERDFPILNVEEVKDMDISILENWAYKKYSWITPLVDIPYHMPWNILLDDYRILHNWNYDEERCKHLEFFNIVPSSVVKLKLAFEYLRSKGLEIRDNIVDFDEHYNSSTTTKILYNHTLSTTPFHDLPDELKGKFDVKDEELNNVHDYSSYL